VREKARGFAAQEANHFKTHRRYNELLKSNGYPELAAVESAMADSYDRIRKNRSLAFRMAYACGFESMTIAVTSWLVDNRVELFGGSDTRVASFILWHFVEECEHKRVAFDVYQASIGSYWQRALGVFTGSLHVVWWARKACLAMLRVDGQGSNPRSRLRLWRRTAQFARAVLPGALRSALPLHNPRNESDPQWVRDWIAGYDRSDPMLHVPLVDTADPVMPVPFPSTGR
jgi:predicted metal-dependent hydrolase